MVTDNTQGVVVTKDEDSYIPEYTLDRIEEEVCKNWASLLQYVSWDKVIPTCINIEQEPLGVYGYLNDIIKQYDKGNSASIRKSIRFAIKMRIYMLLYYRHSNDEMYKKAVLPILRKKVDEEGVGCDIDKEINASLDGILEFERQVREMQTISTEESDDIGEGCEAKIDLNVKMRLELLLRFMESANVDLNIRGNKARAADILQMITSLALSTCKNYITDRNFDPAEKSEEVLKINAMLQSLGVDVRLETSKNT